MNFRWFGFFGWNILVLQGSSIHQEGTKESFPDQSNQSDLPALCERSQGVSEAMAAITKSWHLYSQNFVTRCLSLRSSFAPIIGIQNDWVVRVDHFFIRRSHAIKSIQGFFRGRCVRNSCNLRGNENSREKSILIDHSHDRKVDITTVVSRNNPGRSQVMVKHPLERIH